MLKDYYGSGFDRGHLCPAGDCKHSEEAMDDSFFLTNISPQNPNFNRGYWAALERHVRDLTKEHGSIHVFTGGLYLPKDEADGKRYVKYQVIGANDVAVPTHYFKLILDEKDKPIEAFILPNEPIASNVPLEQFKTTLEKIEKVSGIVFNSK
jgi:endonuclease G, mitochondrial